MTDSSKEPSKGAWTPGPWFVVHDELCEEPWNYDVCAETPSVDKMLVARVRIVPPDGDVEANAKLIAVAPTMAALLRELAEYFKASMRRPEFAHQLAEDHPLVRAERLLTDLYPNEEKF